MSVEENRRVSRRKLVRTAAVSASAVTVGGATAALTTAAGATGMDIAPPGKVAVAGVIVRAEHTLGTEGGLAIGVRAAIQHPALDATGVVLVVGPVAFGRAEEVNARIASGLREQVSALLAERGYPTDPETITVQLFGGAL